MTIEDVTPVKLSMMLGAARLPWRSLWKVNNHFKGLEASRDSDLERSGSVINVRVMG